jgi:arginine/lysine/ornithine decarboxylase
MTHKFRNIENDFYTDVKAPLVEALAKFHKSPMMQFHIPGHTGGKASYKPFKKLIGNNALLLDTTDEFDNLGTLHPATGPIKEAQELAAKAFGAKRTFFLMGGSTLGNLALAMSMTRKGKKVVVNRNCHRSILTGMIISGAEPVWILPEKLKDWSLWGEIEPQEIEKALRENDDVSLVWITNPTYEGVVSDVKAISEICKKYNVPLIVDEAHGCLWNFNKNLPTPALQLGADAVVHSLHKTGGSMSQSSMLHIAENSRFNADEIEKTLQLLQTTSPSMLLMASLDAARANLDSKQGKKLLSRAIQHAKFVRNKLSKINGVNVLEASEHFDRDITKIFISVDGLSGKRLESILEIDFNIEIESASDVGILLLINIGNTKQEIDYLIKSIEKIASSNYSDIYHIENRKHMPMLTPKIIMNPREAYYSKKEVIEKEKAIGRISAEVIAECPPGISILLPGELITEEHLPYLNEYKHLEVIVQ